MYSLVAYHVFLAVESFVTEGAREATRSAVVGFVSLVLDQVHEHFATVLTKYRQRSGFWPSMPGDALWTTLRDVPGREDFWGLLELALLTMDLPLGNDLKLVLDILAEEAIGGSTADNRVEEG